MQLFGKDERGAPALHMLCSGYGAVCKVGPPIFPACFLHWQRLRSLTSGLLSFSHALRQILDYVLVALRMRRPDEAEKLLLFQRLLPALMESRVYQSNAQTRLSHEKKLLFDAVRKCDTDLACGFSLFDEDMAWLSWVCPAIPCCPRKLVARWFVKASKMPKYVGLGTGLWRPYAPFLWLWRGMRMRRRR